MSVNVPQGQRKGGIGQIAQIGGAVAGGILTGGSPAGIATGASIGGMAGGMLDKPAAAAPTVGGGGSMERRASQLDPSSQIKQSQQALAQLPPDYQKEYGPILRRAQQMGATA